MFGSVEIDVVSVTLDSCGGAAPDCCPFVSLRVCLFSIIEIIIKQIV
jgi:hypothetical protein